MKIKSFLVINHNSRTWIKLWQKYFIVSGNPIEESLFATSGNNIFVIQDLKLQTPTTKNCRKLNFGKQNACKHVHTRTCCTWWYTRLSGLTLKSMNFKIRFSSEKNSENITDSRNSNYTLHCYHTFFLVLHIIRNVIWNYDTFF